MGSCFPGLTPLGCFFGLFSRLSLFDDKEIVDTWTAG
jgi:hypothetical protein